jgi:hypothetical protein
MARHPLAIASYLRHYNGEVKKVDLATIKRAPIRGGGGDPSSRVLFCVKNYCSWIHAYVVVEYSAERFIWDGRPAPDTSSDRVG